MTLSKFRRWAPVAGAIAAVSAALTLATGVFAAGGVYDYSSSIVPGTLITDLALMVVAALGIAISARFVFIGARFAIKALHLIK
jgi:hypothetical protein